jgi:multisubunit Na+/H+ antiporter MnhC subunit
VIWVLAACTAVAGAAGAYLASSRDFVRVVAGLGLLGLAVNLLVFAAGRPGPTQPPIIREGEQVLGAAANPLPQALVLTAIVIGFATTCFACTLLLRVRAEWRTEDVDALRAAEPRDPLAAPEGRGEASS